MWTKYYYIVRVMPYNIWAGRGGWGRETVYEMYPLLRILGLNLKHLSAASSLYTVLVTEEYV